VKHFASIKLSSSLLLLACAMAIPSIGAPAQKSKIPPLIAQLNLSEDQKKTLEPLYEEHAKKIKAIREDASISDDDKKEKVRELNQAMNKSLGDVLTAEQRAKLKELRQQRQQQQQKKP
jgi:hypothetical protein